MAANKSRKNRGAQLRRNLPQRDFRPLLKACLLLAAVGVLLYAASAMRQELSAIEVDRVAFDGDVRHADRASLVRRVQPHLAAGFLGMDLDAIQRDLVNDPWVSSAQVQRQWPRELKVTIVEQKPIARWGRGGLVNHRGELFQPGAPFSTDALPLLEGPDGSSERVMRQFQLMSQALSETPLRLHNLALSAGGGWRATVQNETVLVLGRDEPLQNLQRVLQIYQAALQDNFSDVARIDTRYANGVAVAWRQKG